MNDANTSFFYRRGYQRGFEILKLDLLTKLTLIVVILYGFSLSAYASTTAIDGVCGSANGSHPLNAPWSIYGASATQICASGTVAKETGSGPWNWLCVGSNGGTTKNCSATPPVNGACGLANNVPSINAPTGKLCSSGTASPVSNSLQWSWQCAGKHGGSTQSCSALKADAKGALLLKDSYTSNAALAEQTSLCTNKTANYPAQWTWPAAKTTNQPRAATLADKLVPKIEQYRNGNIIATYSSFGSDETTCKITPPTSIIPIDLKAAAAKGCGPFGDIPHVDLFRLWQDGDTFLVYPAVYTGGINNLVLLSKSDYYGGPIYNPQNITIKGVTIDGVRRVIFNTPPATDDYASAQGPVYIGNSANIAIENIDVDNGAITYPFGKAGVYINGADNLLLRQMRIHGFEVRGVNGIFSTKNTTGTLMLDQLEIYENGGSSGPAHNIYINSSKTDPTFTVAMTNSWSHDAFYGHTFKSRAQVNVLNGNYFQGGLPQGGSYTQAENYLVDIPNGGILEMYNNILTKNESGANSNGASITYSVEGTSSDLSATPRTYSIDIENNTFVALSSTFDDQHALWPFFFWHDLTPDSAGFEVPKLPSGYAVPTVLISQNAFVGYCPQTYPGDDFMNYRGTFDATLAFSELRQDFSFIPAIFSDITTVGGTPAYQHAAQAGLLRGITAIDNVNYVIVGARDN